MLHKQFILHTILYLVVKIRQTMNLKSIQKFSMVMKLYFSRPIPPNKTDPPHKLQNMENHFGKNVT